MAFTGKRFNKYETVPPNWEWENIDYRGTKWTDPDLPIEFLTALYYKMKSADYKKYIAVALLERGVAV